MSLDTKGVLVSLDTKGVLVLTQRLPYPCPPNIVLPQGAVADDQTLPVSSVWVQWGLGSAGASYESGAQSYRREKSSVGDKGLGGYQRKPGCLRKFNFSCPIFPVPGFTEGWEDTVQPPCVKHFSF